jgi:hypothetical protein
MRIIDPNGVWLKNTGAFPIHDPDIGVVLPAGETVKVAYSEWAKGQPTVVLDDLLNSTPAEKPAAHSKKA